LTELSSPPVNNHINLIWIPAHRGIEGNEDADTIAKEASRIPSNNNFIPLIPFTDLTELFKTQAFQNILNTITNQGLTKGIDFFTNYHNNNKKPWFFNKKLDRPVITFINRCRSNHYNLASSLAKIKIKNSPLCSCRNAPENLDYVLWSCSLYQNQRKKLVVNLRKANVKIPINCNILLCQPNAKIYKILFEYFESCNLKI